ncbi:MAG: ATP-binding protein [Patescibacteria group bacterium]
MEIFAISGIINAVVAVSFGVLVLTKNWKGTEQRLFFLLTFFLAIWGFCYSQWQLSVTEEEALFWVRALSGASVFIPVSFLDWILATLGKSRKLIPVFYLAALIAASFSYTSLMVPSVGPELNFPYWPKAGILYTFCIFVAYAGMVLYAVSAITSSFLKARDSRTRGRLLYILAGAILGFGGGATNFPLWYGIPIPPYGTFLVAAFPFLLGYSIIRHRLFDLKTIAAEILTFFILIILLVQTVLANTLSEFILRSVFLISVAVLGVLLTRSVYKEVEAREEIEKLARDLEVANKKLKELDQLKSEFLSFATHQLRSPLSAIKGYASLVIEGSYGIISPSAKEASQRIFESAQGLTKIVEDFLNISRIEQGKMKYEFAEADVAILTKEVGEELRPNVEKAGLNMSFVIDGKKSYIARVDIGKTRQIVGNLIDNAIKYTKVGSISVSVKSPVTGLVRIEVKDTGVGIDPETMERLFQKFSRASDANASNTSGTGLGLYVAKEMATGQGGRLWAESDGKGKGSTFIVEFPGLS